MTDKMEDPNLKQRKQLKFARISEKQIVAHFSSKTKKDEYGDPLKLCKILLPSPNLSVSPISNGNEVIKNPTIIVPEYVIKNDKFDDTKKIIGIRSDLNYFIIYDSGKRDNDNHIITNQIHVPGLSLYEAFKIKGKNKDLDERIDYAKSKKHNKNLDDEKGEFITHGKAKKEDYSKTN